MVKTPLFNTDNLKAASVLSECWFIDTDTILVKTIKKEDTVYLEGVISLENSNITICELQEFMYFLKAIWETLVFSVNNDKDFVLLIHEE